MESDTKPKQRFSTPSQVMNAWTSMRDGARVRAAQRAQINEFFAGDPPYTESEAKEAGIETNINWQEPAVLLWQARQKFESAFIHRDRYFEVRLKKSVQDGDLPDNKRREYQNIISEEINAVMKDSQEYTCVLEQLFCSGALHALGVSVWYDRYDWCPEFVGLEDVLFPARTFTNLKNLDYFGIYKRMTYSELKEFSESDAQDDGWNKPLLKKFLDWQLKQEPFTAAANATTYLDPEFAGQDLRENAATYQSDIVPPVSLVDWYFKDTDGKWKRRLCPDFSEQGVATAMPPDPKQAFLYKSDDVAESHEQIVHLLITDLLNTPPFRVGLVRGLGHMLYAPLMVLNRIRCKFSDAVFTSLLELFRVRQADDQERLQMIDLYNYGVVPEGLTWVPGNERYKPDYQLVQANMNQINQTVSEIAASFRSDPDDGTRKEMTAREVMARVNQASAMVGAMLNKAFSRMRYHYREIARRFAVSGSPNTEVQKFQEACERRGVPTEFLDFDRWNVVPNKPVGNGIKTLALAQAEQLMAIRPALPPHAQQKVLHIFVEENSDDPELANELVPIEDTDPSPAVTHGSAAISTLLMGLPYVAPSHVNVMEFAATLVGLLANKVQSIEQGGGIPSQDMVQGLAFAHQYCMKLVNTLAQDKGIDAVVKRLADTLGEIANLIKAFAQRLQEAQQAQGGMDPEAQAAVQAKLIAAQADAKINEAKAGQKMRHQEVKFARDQDRKDAQTQADLQRKAAQTQSDIEAQDIETAAQIRRKNAEARAQENAAEQSDAD